MKAFLTYIEGVASMQARSPIHDRCRVDSHLILCNGLEEHACLCTLGFLGVCFQLPECWAFYTGISGLTIRDQS